MTLRGRFPEMRRAISQGSEFMKSYFIVVVWVGSGIIRSRVALALPVALVVTAPSFLAAIFQRWMLVGPRSEAPASGSAPE
jgi:hypothetical protein